MMSMTTPFKVAAVEFNPTFMEIEQNIAGAAAMAEVVVADKPEKAAAAAGAPLARMLNRYGPLRALAGVAAETGVPVGEIELAASHLAERIADSRDAMDNDLFRAGSGRGHRAGLSGEAQAVQQCHGVARSCLGW